VGMAPTVPGRGYGSKPQAMCNATIQAGDIASLCCRIVGDLYWLPALEGGG